LCIRCNLEKGSKVIQLRPWQTAALNKALEWLLGTASDRHFLINAAPGSGKTIAGCVLAQQLVERGEIDRVIVIAPRAEVVSQWARDFYQITGRYMGKVTGGDQDVSNLGIDICATWAATQGLQDALQAICRGSRVLVICDEHHHAAVSATWGESADSAFADARFVLVLTGTPIRSDGKRSVWLAYDDEGAINHPEEGTYTLTYGEAVDLEYCRPVTFHRHEGHFTVDLEDGQHIEISSAKAAVLPENLKRISSLQRALDFYKLACTPQYESDQKTPLVIGYQATMIDWATRKLDDLRLRMPNAGGLVIAPTIEMAEYMVELITKMEGEAPILVHSQIRNPEGRIQAFRNTDKRWSVSVAMISEGVDIKRLRILVYLPNALTELSFRQAIGRVVRSNGPGDDTRAYVIMPSFNILEEYARRVEDEMSATARKDSDSPKTKRCPTCSAESPLSATFCDVCGTEFPKAGSRFKPCPDCGALNPMTASSCQECGISFGASFTLTLEEALRTGAIVRGMDVEEVDVQASEKMAPSFRRKLLNSGDAKLVKFVSTFPEETWATLKSILDDE
jgi:superfamily II DNA or RNA helicase